MAKNPWKIDEALIDNLKAAADDIEDAINDLRTEFDDRPVKFQESEKGEAVSAWLDLLEDYFGEIDSAIGQFDAEKELEL